MKYNDLLVAFGGENLVNLYLSYFKSLYEKGVIFFLKTNQLTGVIKIVFEKLKLDKFFYGINKNTYIYYTVKKEALNNSLVLNRIYGKDNNIKESNKSNALFLLKIMELLDLGHDMIVYIDSDGNTEQIDKINLCRTYGVKSAKGLQERDLKNLITLFYYW